MAQKHEKDILILTDEAFRKLRRNEDDMVEKYIRCQAFFPEYPVINALLVAVQRPDAEILKPRDTWEKEKAAVRKSERPVIILDMSDLSADKDSIARKELFDVSQTDRLFGSELRIRYKSEILQKGLFSICPVPIESNPRLPSPARYDRKKGVIYVRLKEDDPVEWSFVKTIREVVEAVFYLNSPKQEHETVPWKAWLITKMIMIRYGLRLKEKEQTEMPEQIRNMQEKTFRRTFANMRKVFYQFYEAFEWSVAESRNE